MLRSHIVKLLAVERRVRKNKEARTRRAGLFVRAAGMRARKLFTAGVKPQMAFVIEVMGLTDGELLRAQRLEAKFLKPSTRGRSLTALLLLRGSQKQPPWHGQPL